MTDQQATGLESARSFRELFKDGPSGSLGPERPERTGRPPSQSWTLVPPRLTSGFAGPRLQLQLAPPGAPAAASMGSAMRSGRRATPALTSTAALRRRLGRRAHFRHVTRGRRACGRGACAARSPSRFPSWTWLP